MAPDHVRYSVTDGVATIALDDPDTRNSLSDEMLDGLIGAFETARDDDAVRCVVLTSTHEKVFSSGGNLKGFAADVAAVGQAPRRSSAFPRLFAPDRRARQAGRCAPPTATYLPVRSDSRWRATSSSPREGVRFGTPEINVGVFPFMIMALIYRNVGRKKTNELLLLGRADLRRGGRADRDRQPCRAGRRVRRGGRRLGRRGSPRSPRC